jgi:hypothetical protein
LERETLKLDKMKLEAENLNEPLKPVSSRFVNVKLRRDTVEAMISTYEFLVWNNVGEEKKECKRILKALKKALS